MSDPDDEPINFNPVEARVEKAEQDEYEMKMSMETVQERPGPVACPVCIHLAPVDESYPIYKHFNDTSVLLVCDGCRMSTPIFDTMDDALEFWNKIASAHDLFEACELALNAFEKNWCIDWGDLERAIAKAKGEA